MTGRTFLLTFLLFFFAIPFTSFASEPAGGRYSAMGGVSVISSDVWSCFHNQAGLGFLEQSAAGVSMHNAFGMKELSTYSFAGAVLAGNGAFGISYRRFGNQLYSSEKTGLAYGMRLSPKVAAGVQLDMFHTRIGMDYGRKNIFTFEAGIQAEVKDGWFVSAHIFNPIRAKLADYMDERLSSALAFGILWRASDKAFFALELRKDESSPPVLKSGIEYRASENFFIRGGINTFNAETSFGAGYRMSRWSFDIASTLHPQLGLSHHISAVHSFGKKR